MIDYIVFQRTCNSLQRVWYSRS